MGAQADILSIRAGLGELGLPSEVVSTLSLGVCKFTLPSCLVRAYKGDPSTIGCCGSLQDFKFSDLGLAPLAWGWSLPRSHTETLISSGRFLAISTLTTPLTPLPRSLLKKPPKPSTLFLSQHQSHRWALRW